jgi:hypothetical protein
VSLTENFLNAAKQILLVTESIKQLNEKVHTLSASVAEFDRQVIYLEAYSQMGRPFPRHRSITGKSE